MTLREVQVPLFVPAPLIMKRSWFCRIQLFMCAMDPVNFTENYWSGGNASQAIALELSSSAYVSCHLRASWNCEIRRLQFVLLPLKQQIWHTV